MLFQISELRLTNSTNMEKTDHMHCNPSQCSVNISHTLFSEILKDAFRNGLTYACTHKVGMYLKSNDPATFLQHKTRPLNKPAAWPFLAPHSRQHPFPEDKAQRSSSRTWPFHLSFSYDEALLCFKHLQFLSYLSFTRNIATQSIRIIFICFPIQFGGK